MSKFIDLIVGSVEEKKEWRAMEARAKALPKEYRIVYNEVKHYIWKSSGLDAIDIFKGLLDLFEEGAANGTSVLEITGENVAAFCDELVKGGKTYAEDWRTKLNKDIAKKLGK